MTPSSEAKHRLARLVQRGMSAARARLPEGDTPVTRLLRPLSARLHRATLTLEASPLLEAEARLRAQIEVRPDSSDLWWELGLCLSGQRRPEDAAEAWLRAGELGSRLRPAVMALHNRPLVRAVAAGDAALERMRAIAAAHSDDGHVLLDVGTYLLDQGLLEEGRALVRRGYRLRDPHLPFNAADDWPSLAPSYFIVGPEKTGTTTLEALLSQHPQVISPPRKELRFWGNEYERPPEVYDAYFPPLAADTGFVTGDASPNYLHVPRAAAGVAARYPQAKAIVMRRDPVARSYSHFQMMRRRHGETRTFEEVIDEELRLVGPSAPLTLDEIPARHGTYLMPSAILPYLRMWINALGAERVIVIDSDYFGSDQQATLDLVHAQLGLEPARLRDERARNVGSYEPMQVASEARLRAWFAPHEAALDRLLSDYPNQVPRHHEQEPRSAR